MMFFSWLRRKAAEAILAGVQDAGEILDQQVEAITDEEVKAFRERFAASVKAIESKKAKVTK
jgi:hypothetical protein